MRGACGVNVRFKCGRVDIVGAVLRRQGGLMISGSHGQVLFAIRTNLRTVHVE